MTKDFDTLLDECIDRMNEGKSIEECLAGYPEHAKELGSLLRAVRNVHNACSVIPGATATSAARRRLDAALVSSERALQKHQRGPGPLSGWSRAWTKISEEMDMKLRRRRWGIIVTAAALILAFAAYQLFLPGPQAMAHLTMQVNPALQLSLDREHKVIGVEGLDENGKALVAQLDIQNKVLQQALREITAALVDRGFLSPERRIVMVLHPVAEREKGNLPDLSAIAHQAVATRLVEMNVQIKVVSQVISEELYETAIEKGLLPAAYADLLEAAVSEDNIKSIIGLGKELGIGRELFLKEFYTIASATIDMVEAGITEADALAMIREAMKADRSLGEVTTITAAIVDMREAGLTHEHSLALMRLRQELERLGIAKETFLEEFSTIAAAMIDMVEAGITEAHALAVIREAMKADPSLEEVTTITAAIVDMHEAGLTPAHSLALVRLHQELGKLGIVIAKDTFLEEFSTIASAMIDMAEAGITEAAALAVIREAMKADPSLEEVATIVADVIDLVEEEGMSVADALDKVKAAIGVDPEQEPQEKPEDEPGVDPEQEPQEKPEDEPGVGPEQEPQEKPEDEPGVGPEQEPQGEAER